MLLELVLVMSSSYTHEVCLYRRVPLTLLMLVFVRRVPLTPRVILSEEVLIHLSCWFSLVSSFSYTPHAFFIREEFLIQLMRFLVKSFSYTLDVIFICEEFLLHSSGHLFY